MCNEFLYENVSLRLEAFLPDGLDVLAEVIDDVAAYGATAGGEEAADDASDVAADVELLRIIDALAFHTQTETADAWQHHRVAVAQPGLHQILQVRDDRCDRAICITLYFLG